LVYLLGTTQDEFVTEIQRPDEQDGQEDVHKVEFGYVQVQTHEESSNLANLTDKARGPEFAALGKF
jgi:hypothetical protein